MNELHHRLTHNLDKISLMRRIFTQRSATRDGICLGQLPVLRYVHQHPGCTQKDVADFMQVSAPSVAVMVKRMVRDGVIEKAPDEHDMRQNRLTITKQGEDLSEQCKQLFDRLDEQAYAGFSDEELELLSSFLDRLINNLASDEVRNASPFSLMKMMKELEQTNPNNKKKEE